MSDAYKQVTSREALPIEVQAICKHIGIDPDDTVDVRVIELDGIPVVTHVTFEESEDGEGTSYLHAGVIPNEMREWSATLEQSMEAVQATWGML